MVTGSPHSPSIHMSKERQTATGTSLISTTTHAIAYKHVNDENSRRNVKSNLEGIHNATLSPSPSTPPQPSSAHSSFRQQISYNAASNKTSSPFMVSSLSSHFYLQPQTPTMFHNTPCGSVYNPQFSKEHIMNIIKHKALQKLKKIESEVRVSLFSNLKRFLLSFLNFSEILEY